MIVPRRDTAAGQGAAALRLADALSLAAAPTFAAMAALTSLSGGSGDMLCGAPQSPLGGMVPMYLLMSAFHAATWLKRFPRRGHAR